MDLNKMYLFRITHIENISHILQYGITHVTSINANLDFVPIGDNGLISTRNSFILNNNRYLGNYIPFYFGTRTPMLYVVQKSFNAENIVYCVSSVQKIIDLQLDFVFTDGHAIERITTQYYPIDIQNIDTLLDWKAVKAKYWKDENDLDLKRRKQAEFLVLGNIAHEAILGYITYNENAKNKIINFGAEAAKVHIKPEYYF